MNVVFRAEHLTKRYEDVLALDDIDLAFPEGSVIGLIGRNGSGKTTLLHHAVGLVLPTEGESTTLGCPSHSLGDEQLARIGFVPQETRFLDWMTVDDHIDYVAGFYSNWDRQREKRLRGDLELDGGRLVGALSSGNVQKLALVLAVCHHPQLLIVDEPVSDIDPIVRARLLAFLLELIRDDGSTVVISSHVLRDIAQVVDRIVCLHHARIAADAPLDELKDRFARWAVRSPGTPLPDHFDEDFVLGQQVDGGQALLEVDCREADRMTFAARHGVAIESHPLNLERLFPLLVRGEREP